MKEILQERIDLLTRSRDDFFKKYYNEFYDKKVFPHSSYYFHKRVLNMINECEYSKLFDNNLYFEYIYATLSTWGMDRLTRSALLNEFSIFKNSAVKYRDKLINLSKVKLKDLDDNQIEGVKSKLSFLFDKLDVMETSSKLVGVSKALHHFLPELVLPIDRKYTINFFYEKNLKSYPYIKKKNEKTIFLKIFEKSYFICKKLNLSEDDLKKKWDTSIPKLIDNSIIGFVEKELKSINKKNLAKKK